MTPADTHLRAADLFLRLVDLAPEARESALRAEPDAAVRDAARAMLRGHDDATGPLDTPLVARPEASGGGASGMAASGAGTRVGPWEIEGVLGEGGMGVVYLARRADGAYEREVALKRLHAGPDTAGLAARLRAERQILARLEHPGIARLYDGGVDASGAPYLVMERVRGVPITDYAEAHRLSVRQRVRLAVEVCEGVAYAHQNLVVHRDLKPSNILVTEGEGARVKSQEGKASGEAREETSGKAREAVRETATMGSASGARSAPLPSSPVPLPSRAPRVKLLDFGIAKLLGDESDDLTRTRAALTPAYAAPEQVRGEAITTATDVYALGVLLYELLAGDRPYHLSGVTAAEAERIVCHTVPPPVSTAAPEARRRALRGDLDVVVAKALAKEPARRYPSAEALGADLKRYLDGVPIVARPATARYRTSRFVKRHRVGVAASALVVLSLLAGAGVALWQAAEARAERHTAERVNAFVTEMLASASPYEGGRRDVTVAEVADAAASRLDALAGEPATEAGVRLALGATYRGTGAYEKADLHLTRALALRQRLYGPRHPSTADALDALGALNLERSAFARADSLFALSLAIRQRHPGPRRAAYASTLAHRGQVALQMGELDRAVALLREATGLLRRTPPPQPLAVAGALDDARYGLGLALHERGDYAAADSVLGPLAREMRARDTRAPASLGSALSILAWNNEALSRTDEMEPLLSEALAFREQRFGARHPQTGYAHNDLGYYHQYYTRDVPLAEASYRRALAIFREAHGDDAAAVPSVLNNLGSIYRESGRAPEAVPLLEEAAALQREILGPEHVDISYPLINLGRAYVAMGQPTRAEAPLREALRLRIQSDGPVHRRVGIAQEALAVALLAAGRRADAIDLFRRAVATLRDALGPAQVDVAEVEVSLADALAASGERDEARRLVAHARPILHDTYPDGNTLTARADALAERLGQ